MNVYIIHKDTHSVRLVRELDDILFADGWRFHSVVSSNNTDVITLDDTMHEMYRRKELGYTALPLSTI